VGGNVLGRNWAEDRDLRRITYFGNGEEELESSAGASVAHICRFVCGN
jgi:hypothetical protein